MILMAVAAFGLATGSVANARLGWTLADCTSVWGQPIKVEYRADVDLPVYVFKAQSGLYVQVFFLNEEVNSIVYFNKSKSFLVNNANQLLTKNYSGDWTLFDDGLGKQTAATWHVLNPIGGDLVAYAILFNKAEGGFYGMQISTSLWDAYLKNHNVNGANQTSQKTALNI